MTPENHGHPYLNITLSIVGAMFAWVTLKDVQVIMTIIATTVSMASGVMAMIQLHRKNKRDEQQSKK